MKSILKWFKSTKPKSNRLPITVPDQIMKNNTDITVNTNMEDSLTYIEKILGENDDFVIRRFNAFGRHKAVLCYYCNMVDQSAVNTDILKALMYVPAHLDSKIIELHDLKEVLINDALYHTEAKRESKLNHLIEGLVRGHTVVIVDGLDEAFMIGTRNIDKRTVDQPATEMVIRGPREGFIELLGTNIALLRYRLQTPDFRMHTMEIGRRTRSKVAICFVEGITKPELVQEVKNRLSKIDISSVLDSGILEQYIEDNHLSPFPQVQYTERPDKVVSNLLEGRVAILVDGSPMALVVPTIFSQLYQTVEDYNERFLLMSSIRMARLVALIFSLIFPSLYVAIISFNPELIPTEFAVAVAGGRAGVPFPAIIEVLIIEISMEVLREATIRLPQQVGGALSIVGVLVIGQAAVSAGFASPITIVIIALTTIGSFATPAYNAALALRLLRFPLIVLGGIFGLYGIMIGLILIANHLLSLKSFGVPYLSPLVPGNFEGMKDLLFRSPMWFFKKRPSMLQTIDDTPLNPNTMDELKSTTENVLDPLNYKEKGR